MDQKKELELIFDMTSHPGWKYLCDDLEKRVDALKEGMITNESTPYQIGLAQGHVKVYREIIALRRLLDHVLTEKEAQEAADGQADSV
jgi:hypothetical protein